MKSELIFLLITSTFPTYLSALKCYSSFCLDGSQFCEQTCINSENACISSFNVDSRGSTVDLLLFQCSHASSSTCNNPVCNPNQHDSGIHSCCCNTDLCNFVPTTEFTSPPILPTPEGTAPSFNDNQLVCESYNCSVQGSECFYGYETCSTTPSVQTMDMTYQYCLSSLRYESNLDSYSLQEKRCVTTSDMAQVAQCEDACTIDTSSSTPQVSCCCFGHLCNSEAMISYSDVSRLSFVDDPCAANLSCSHSCIVVSGLPRCLCPAGFILDGSNQTCVDINECMSPNHCEVCVNLNGSFSCACSGNRVLQEDGFTCEDPTGLLCSRYTPHCNKSVCQPSTSHCVNEYSADASPVCLATYYLRDDGSFDQQIAACFASQQTTTSCVSDNECVLTVHPSQLTVYTCCCTTNFCNSHIRVVFPNITDAPNTTATTLSTPFMTTHADTVSTQTDPTNGTPGSGNRVSLIVFIVIVVVFVVIILVVFVGLVVLYFYKKRKKLSVSRHSDVGGDNMAILSPEAENDGLELEELIGHGQFASVWRASHQGTKVAVKVFVKKDSESYRSELEIYMTPLKHKNILRFIGHYDSDQTHNLVFEFQPRGSLYHLLKNNIIELRDFLDLAESVAAGLAYLHQESTTHPVKPAIAHRDLKSKNVLVKSDGQCCISDFGLAVKFQSGTEHIQISHGQVGTSRYMAPEVLEGAINFGRDPYLRIDDYALGLIVWEIASRTIIPNATVKDYHAPFEEETPPNPTIEEMRAVVVTRQQRPAMPSGFQNNAVFDPITVTISEAWDADAESRLSAQCVFERIRSFRIEHFGTGSQISKDSGFHHEQDTLQSLSSPPAPATPSLSSIASDRKPSAASTSYEPAAASVHNPKSSHFFAYNFSHSTETTV